MYLNELYFKFTFVMSNNVHQNANQNSNNKLPFKLANINNKLKKFQKKPIS
jgi:hypothetical protein